MTSPLGVPLRVCPICSTPHAACKGADPQHVIDVPTATAKEPVVADRFWFEVPLRDGVTTEMKLTEAEAKEQYGSDAKKGRPAQVVGVQPVQRPEHATNASDVTERPPLDEDEAQPAEHLVTSPNAKRAAPPQNKRR